jgi:hypothetical protein
MDYLAACCRFCVENKFWKKLWKSVRTHKAASFAQKTRLN